MSTILDNKLANIVSSSYSSVGETLSSMTIQGMVNLHLQAAGEGIGLYYASGDDGDQSADLGYPAPQFPASSPWVTSVGGTSLAIDSKGSIAWETGWGGRSDQIVENANGRLALAEPLPGRNFDGGAGGGASALFREPDYQSGVVPPSLSRGFRVSADIAALADPLTGIRPAPVRLARSTSAAALWMSSMPASSTTIRSPGCNRRDASLGASSFRGKAQSSVPAPCVGWV
ncbi:S8/S53 family peptidase [Leifsonia xyli]|uniref:hypothetical protein n=1 Tax=Leifsonia xyli TaxID=1575 RepID=UPI000693382C|nr:hypothetical protein [Leifsonia xyli]